MKKMVMVCIQDILLEFLRDWNMAFRNLVDFGNLKTLPYLVRILIIKWNFLLFLIYMTILIVVKMSNKTAIKLFRISISLKK